MAELARTVGQSRGVAYNQPQAGLTNVEADEWAMACGLHPLEVWGELWA